MSSSVLTPARVSPYRAVSLLCDITIVGIALYLVLDIVAQLLPPHYSPIRQAESDLAVGPYGWVMTLNFVVRGLLSLSLLAALWQVLKPLPRARIGLVLLAIWAIGALILAANPTDVAASAHHLTLTRHGKIHLATAAIAFLCIPIAEELLSSSLLSAPGLAAIGARARSFAHLTVLGFAILIVFALIPNIGGLGERIFLATALLWMLVVAWQLRSSTSR